MLCIKITFSNLSSSIHTFQVTDCQKFDHLIKLALFFWEEYFDEISLSSIFHFSSLIWKWAPLPCSKKTHSSQYQWFRELLLQKEIQDPKFHIFSNVRVVKGDLDNLFIENTPCTCQKNIFLSILFLRNANIEIKKFNWSFSSKYWHFCFSRSKKTVA